MNETIPLTLPTDSVETVVASYADQSVAETAVRHLAEEGVAVQKISIIGRNSEGLDDIEVFHAPSDAVAEGAREGAVFGGIFGLLTGISGFFLLPVIGSIFILGPLASLVTGAIGGAGVGALTTSLVQMGIPHDQALQYQERLQAGEFLVVLHGTAQEVAQAHEILSRTMGTYLQTHRIHTLMP